jgi:hypothetical protein
MHVRTSTFLGRVFAFEEIYLNGSMSCNLVRDALEVRLVGCRKFMFVYETKF